MIHYIEHTTSTNDDARLPQYKHLDVICAERQGAGRGQRGNKWLSPEGLNLTFSVVLEPDFIEAHEQFLITQIVSLSVADCFKSYGIDSKIKWTNDIYIGDDKAVGILIENSLSGTKIRRSVVGIGINVNQTEFDPELPNPTSMTLASSKTYDRNKVLECYMECLAKRYEALQRGHRERITADYHSHIYRLSQEHTYRLADGTFVQATIQGVRPTGELILRHADGSQGEYLFKQVEFVIEKRGR